MGNQYKPIASFFWGVNKSANTRMFYGSNSFKQVPKITRHSASGPIGSAWALRPFFRTKAAVFHFLRGKASRINCILDSFAEEVQKPGVQMRSWGVHAACAAAHQGIAPFHSRYINWQPRFSMPISTVGAQQCIIILSGLTAWHSPSESPMAPSSTKATERNQAAVCLTMPIACSNWVWILALKIAGPSCNLVDSRRAGAMRNWERRNKIEKYDKDWQSAFGSPWWGCRPYRRKLAF